MANPHGSFIWYELMTTDPDGAKSFYDAVVGWDIQPPPPGDLDYRMIGRSDGKHAGGVLRINEDMRQNGARPVWLGYIGVEDVDQSVEAVNGHGGRTIVPPQDLPSTLR